MIDRKNGSILCLIVIGLCLGSAAIRHAAIFRHPSTQPVAIQPSTQPVTIQISSELRQELVALQVALERGLTQSEMRERSHAITTQLRLDSAGMTPDFKAVEVSLGALEHFWNRCLDNPSCVLTNEMDLYWLAETGLEKDTNVWEAFDIDGSIAAFKLKLSEKTALTADISRDMVSGHSRIAQLAIESSIEKQKIEDLEKVDAFIKDQQAHLDEILDAAIARHDSVDPTYLVKVLKERAYRQSNKLLGK
jgi:hypothetical protein